MKRYLLKLLTLCFLLPINIAMSATLIGWADMPKNTLTAGPYHQHQPKTKWVPPGAQTIGGFSAGLKGNNGQYIFLSDSGYGKRTESFSSLLGLYELKLGLDEGYKKASVSKLLYFNDVDHKLSFSKQADYEHYGNNPNNKPVDTIIKDGQLLTGGDLSPESVSVDYKGNIWVGEEFGPFLIKLDQTGKVLRSEITIPNVISPDSPLLKTDQVTTVASGSGIEGMAMNPQGNKLFAMLENPMIRDPDKTVRIYEFDIDNERFESGYYRYPLDQVGSGVKTLVAVNDHEFLTVEQYKYKNNIFKKVYLFSINGVSKLELVKKTELVNLMDIDDPKDLNLDKNNQYSFKGQTIEAMVIVDENTLLLANDNNTNGRTKFSKVQLDAPLNLTQFHSPILDTQDWESRDKNYLIWRGFHTLSAWVCVIAYFLLFVFLVKQSIEFKKAKHDIAGKLISISILVFALFLYRHLIGHWYLTEYFRDVFIDWNLYKSRDSVQYFIVLEIIAVAIIGFLFVLFFYNSKHVRLTIASVILLLGFKCVQIVSYHHVDRYIDILFGYGRPADVIETFLVCLVFFAVSNDIKRAITNSEQVDI